MKNKRAMVFGAGTLLALVIMMIYNLITTWQVLDFAYGGGTKDQQIAIIAFAIGISIADFAPLGRVLLPSQKDDERLKWALGVTWFAALLADGYLSYLWGALYLQTSAFPPALHGAVNILPIGIAIIEIAVRIPLVYAVGNYGDVIFAMAKDRKVGLPNGIPHSSVTNRSSIPQQKPPIPGFSSFSGKPPTRKPPTYMDGE